MKHTSPLLVASLVAVSVMGLGCNPFASVQEKIGVTVAEKILEAGAGGKIDVDVESGGVVFKDPKTGEAISLGTNVKIPSGFPTDIPIYSGAIPSTAVLTQDGKRAALVVTVFDAESSQLTEWYNSQLIANGYERKSETDITKTFFNKYVKGNVKMSVIIAGQKDKSGRQVATIQINREETAK